MREEFRQQGYVLIKSFTAVAELRADMESVFRDYIGRQSPLRESDIFELFQRDFQGFYGCANLCQYLPSLSKLASCDCMIRALHHLGLKNPVINTRPLVSFSARGLAKNDSYWKIPAHQDWPSTLGSLNGVTCWIPLCDVTPELGPLEMVPGSHLQGPRAWKDSDGVPVCADESQFEGRFKPIDMGAGDALFFSYFTVHRSGVNKTADRIRWTVHLRYDDRSEPSFSKRKYPKNRKDVRVETELPPGYPSPEEVRKALL